MQAGMPCSHCLTASALLRPLHLRLPSPALPCLQAVGLRDFLLPMLDFDPSRRASAAQMLQHPWMRGELPAAVLLNNITPGGGVVERSLRVKWGSPKSPSAVASPAPSSPSQ